MPVITTEQVRRHMTGVIEYLDDRLPRDTVEGMIQGAIATAEAEFERRLRILLTPKTIRMNPERGSVGRAQSHPSARSGGAVTPVLACGARVAAHPASPSSPASGSAVAGCTPAVVSGHVERASTANWP